MIKISRLLYTTLINIMRRLCVSEIKKRLIVELKKKTTALLNKVFLVFID